jgi:hypothetical protein
VIRPVMRPVGSLDSRIAQRKKCFSASAVLARAAQSVTSRSGSSAASGAPGRSLTSDSRHHKSFYGNVLPLNRCCGRTLLRALATEKNPQKSKSVVRIASRDVSFVTPAAVMIGAPRRLLERSSHRPPQFGIPEKRNVFDVNSCCGILKFPSARAAAALGCLLKGSP